MGGRYGKYGEIKRFERLRKNRGNVSRGQGRPHFLKDSMGGSRASRRKFRHRSPED